MIKLLIVDDESFTREGIIDMISWETLGITEIEQAFDGINGLEIASDFEPDILLTDVRMPRMDGIQLAFKIRDLYPKCTIIFMSGYSDKEYLKSAIKLKAISYVEKPIELDELHAALETAVLDIKKNKTISFNIENSIALEMITQEKNKNIFNIFNGYFPADFSSVLSQSNYITILIKTVNSVIENKENIISDLKNIIVKHDFNSFISLQNETQIVIHLFFSKDKKNIDSDLKSLFSSISDYVNKTTNHFICVGKKVESIFEVYSSYNAAYEILNCAYYFEYSSVLYNKDISKNTYVVYEKLYSDFETYLLKEDKQNLFLLVKRLTLDIKNYPFTSPAYVKDIYYKLLLIIFDFSESRNLDSSEFLNKDYIFENLLKFNTIYETEEYVQNKIINIFVILSDKSINNNPVIKIINYINDNYADVELSLDSISRNTFLTPAYICVIFKEYTGNTVNKYINEFRLEKAKALLTDTDIKINNIAGMVGYSDGNYFAKIFRKEIGYTPSEYRRKFAK